MSRFQKATKYASRARVALCGPSGSGKTYTALAIATAMHDRVAVIDTERGSASKYADLFPFDVLELDSFSPGNYVQALQDAASEGYGAIIVDSLSHAWFGKDGAIEQVDRAAARDPRGNSFTAWREVTPQQNALVDAMLRVPAHLIVTMRTKTEYVMEQKGGKQVPRKVGMAPIQRDGLEYEFDVVGEMNLDNNMVISKTRCPKLAAGLFHHPGKDVAAVLLEWLAGDERPVVAKAPDVAPAEETLLAEYQEMHEHLLAVPTLAEAEAQLPAVKALGERLWRAGLKGTPESLYEKNRDGYKAALARCKPVAEKPGATP